MERSTDEGPAAIATEANVANGASIRLGIIAKCRTTGGAFRRLCASACNVHVVCELASIDTAAAELDRTLAAVALLGPSITLDECLRLHGDLDRLPQPPAIVTIQVELQPETVRALMQHGIHGILDEHATEQDLALAIAVVATGQSFISRHARGLLATPRTTRQDILLAPREREMLGLLMIGESNDGIARRLHVSVKTVEMHLSHIYGKLGVCSRVQAVVRAQGLGLLIGMSLPSYRGPRR